MKPLLLLSYLFIFTACSRYHYLPKATYKKQIGVVNVVGLTPKVTAAVIPQLCPELKNEPPAITYLEKEGAIAKSQHAANIKPKKQGQLGSALVSNQQDTSDFKPKKSKYKNYGTTLLVCVLSIPVGVLLFITDNLGLMLLGSLIFALSSFIIPITLLLLLIALISDSVKKRKIENREETYETRKENADSTNRESNSNTKEAPNTESPKADSQKDAGPEQPTKNKKPQNKIKYMYINLLLANIAIWIATKIKFEK